MINKKIGNEFETTFCEMLYEKGFWVHNLTQNKAGQPVDIIAAKDKKTYLIDCKVCSNDYFNLSRIEPNQHSAMNLWRDCGNLEPWFAIKIENYIFMVTHWNLKAISRTHTVLNLNDIATIGITFERWCEKCI